MSKLFLFCYQQPICVESFIFEKKIKFHFFGCLCLSLSYILTMFRLVREGMPVVYLQHGILASAWCWLDNKPEHSAGFAL